MFRVVLKDHKEYVNVMYYEIWEDNKEFIKLTFQDNRPSVVIALDVIKIIEPYTAIDWVAALREMSKNKKQSQNGKQ